MRYLGEAVWHHFDVSVEIEIAHVQIIGFEFPQTCTHIWTTAPLPRAAAHNKDSNPHASHTNANSLVIF